MRLLTVEQVRYRLRKIVAHHGGYRDAARSLGVAFSCVNRVLNEVDDPPPKLLKALGLRREVRFVEVSE